MEHLPLLSKKMRNNISNYFIFRKKYQTMCLRIWLWNRLQIRLCKSWILTLYLMFQNWNRKIFIEFLVELLVISYFFSINQLLACKNFKKLKMSSLMLQNSTKRNSWGTKEWYFVKLMYNFSRSNSMKNHQNFSHKPHKMKTKQTMH